MKIGILGGTFNPVHKGHLKMAEDARRTIGLDSVILIPAGQPWLKAGRPLVSGNHRLKMIKLAIQTKGYLTVSDLELRRPGPTYTSDTLEEITKAKGDKTHIYFIAGLDALEDFEKWDRPQRVLELATIVGVVRPGYETLQKEKMERIQFGAAGKIVIVSHHPIDVSGTEIRNNVAKGRSIRGHVTQEVEKYITDNRLYSA